MKASPTHHVEDRTDELVRDLRIRLIHLMSHAVGRVMDQAWRQQKSGSPLLFRNGVDMRPGQLAHFKSHRALLASIRSYRNCALGHVTSTMVQLQQLSADLEDLRDRVATPLLLNPDIPLEVREVHSIETN